jgi:hypothetical protein
MYQESPQDQYQYTQYPSYENSIPQTEESFANKDCKYGESILENKIQVMTKIEKYTDIKNQIKINNKLKEFALSQTGERYSQNIQWMLSDPEPVELSVISESLQKCNTPPQDDGSQQYYLCKYREIGERTLSEYIKEHPEDISRILDQHDQLLKTIGILSEEKKLIHYAIQNNNIIIKEIDDNPVITNFKQSSFLYYEGEMNMNNFETILLEAREFHSIEAHILVYLGKKKQNVSIDEWKNQKYDNNQHMEATGMTKQGQQTYTEYIDKTYEEVYREIQQTFSKWDIYSTHHMFLTILNELQETSLELYKSKLTELLSSKTIDLTIMIPAFDENPPPSEQPPSEQPPSEQPPSEQPPSEQPPSEQPPSEQPPSEQPPSEQQPPTEQPPSEQQPPTEQPPTEQQPPTTNP